MDKTMVASLFAGLLFGVAFFLVSLLIVPEIALWVGLLAGVLFVLLFYPAMLLAEKSAQKKFAKAEAAITAPVFLKANGNFETPKGVRNGNIYFCEDGIVLICVEEKPTVTEFIPLAEISRYEFDQIHMNLHTKDGRVYRITTAQAHEILDMLKKKG